MGVDYFYGENKMLLLLVVVILVLLPVPTIVTEDIRSCEFRHRILIVTVIFKISSSSFYVLLET